MIEQKTTNQPYHTYELHGEILASYIEYGKQGMKGTGAKVHRLHVTRLVGLVEGYELAPYQTAPGSYITKFRRTGQPVVISVHSSCNGSGQFTGIRQEGLTEAHITCQKCKA